MSRQLPPHSNLEYLKKQVKDLLRDMRQRDPAYNLADAQHAIARRYWFSSWPKLKAREALTAIAHIALESWLSPTVFCVALFARARRATLRHAG